MKKIKQLLHQERGSVVLLAAFSLLAILAMAGVVIDGGTVYMTKAHLQKTANAAVLSGAQELTNQEAMVQQVIGEVLEAHDAGKFLIASSVDMERKASIQLHQEVPLIFLKLFGIDQTSVDVKASAEVRPMGRAVGAAPLGINEDIGLNYYTPYKLKVDETESDTGNFGILALGAPGAKTYEYNLKNGYDHEIKVGDIIDTETGNVVEKTREGIKERLDACPYLDGETFHRDCSRILLIPVYRPYNQTSNQLKQIKITGFAYFYITEPVNNFDKTISGMFVKRAGTSFVDPNSVNRGAYSIRLTE